MKSAEKALIRNGTSKKNEIVNTRIHRYYYSGNRDEDSEVSKTRVKRKKSENNILHKRNMLRYEVEI